VNGEAITQGHIYVAPPDHHLLVEPGHVRCTHGPKEHRFRPAVDVLFRSAAYAYGPRVVGVVLTGMLGDGTAGLGAIKDHGGVAIVQEPQEALWASMPQNALQQVAVDYRLPLAEVAPTPVGLSARPPPEERAFPISTQESP
jgi:two-component system, chemotaxis family, protein-glutamate methylesterase/glutaminase